MFNNVNTTRAANQAAALTKKEGKMFCPAPYFNNVANRLYSRQFNFKKVGGRWLLWEMT